MHSKRRPTYAKTQKTKFAIFTRDFISAHRHLFLHRNKGCLYRSTLSTFIFGSVPFTRLRDFCFSCFVHSHSFDNCFLCRSEYVFQVQFYQGLRNKMTFFAKVVCLLITLSVFTSMVATIFRTFNGFCVRFTNIVNLNWR